MAPLTTIDECASRLIGSSTALVPPRPSQDMSSHIKDAPSIPVSLPASSCATPVSTPMTSMSSQQDSDGGNDSRLRDLRKYIALGCLHFDRPIPIDTNTEDRTEEWIELLFSGLPSEVKQTIGDHASRLLEASWIRLFLHHPKDIPTAHTLPSAGSNLRPIRARARVYLLPEDWGRRLVDRKSKSLKAALRQLLRHIDISPEAWSGDLSEAEIRQFDPWATAENVSLFYLFNKLPSPAPSAERIKSRFSRNAVWGLLDSVSPIGSEFLEDQSIVGLKTRLYPYQARSASMMIQRESAPQLQLDPRLEVRASPTGERFYFGAREGSFLQEPRFYESNRGGILAETMGLGKTIICLALVLATKGHMPQIPPGYQPPPPIRKRVGSLADMAASIIGRYAIPGKAYLEQIEAANNVDLRTCKQRLERNLPHYEIPVELPRLNRTTRIPPPQQLVMCSGTIIVVPRNLLHQWQAEIRKHLDKGALKILVMDSKPKRAPKSRALRDEEGMDCRSDIPTPTELMKYDVVLFTRNRFEQEVSDGADESGRRFASGVPLICSCPYIGATRLRDCHCLTEDGVYESPLKKVHWLRIIIDEGHNFSSGVSNAVLVAKQLQAERRWVVSGTPAKNLVGAEVDLSTLDQEGTDPAILRELAVEQRRTFSLDDDNTKAAKALGSLASNFLMVRPWSDSSTEGKLPWDDYMYRHEHQYLKTFTGFSSCFLQTLEGLVVKTRPEDVDRDIQLPPMRHRTVYLKPCWFDKMTANLFIQVLRANAITSERTDVDYLFHKNSVQAKHSLIKNLRQSNFTWTGFSLEDVISTLETSAKYLGKDDKKCTLEDANSLLESSRVVSDLMKSQGWIALSKAHEVGIAVEKWPQDSEEDFSLSYPEQPSTIGITQLLDGQSHVDGQILLENPAHGLQAVGQVAKAKLVAVEEAENAIKKRREKESREGHMAKAGVPSSCVGGQPLTSRRTSAMSSKASPMKPASPKISMKFSQRPQLASTDILLPVTNSELDASKATSTPDDSVHVDSSATPVSPVRPKKRRLTLADETAELPIDSLLRKTRVVGTTSAKLTYLIDMVMKHQAQEKIIIFYDGDNAAYYIAQCLEMLYINHRIYARTLDNTKRSQYVALFNEDPDVRVLLIDVACGALGLNLNAASVVLIVNPINRPGIEAQAIKRAHRIGQTKEVLVETLVLEGTIEEAIFKRAKNMSRREHSEAKTLEDDNEITKIIQDAKILPISPNESRGQGQFALLQTSEQVFGRPDRHKYHRFGQSDAKSPEKPKKRVRTAVNGSRKKTGVQAVDASTTLPSAVASLSQIPILGPALPQLQPQVNGGSDSISSTSIFGDGNPSQSSWPP